MPDTLTSIQNTEKPKKKRGRRKKYNVITILNEYETPPYRPSIGRKILASVILPSQQKKDIITKN